MATSATRASTPVRCILGNLDPLKIGAGGNVEHFFWLWPDNACFTIVFVDTSFHVWSHKVSHGGISTTRNSSCTYRWIITCFISLHVWYHRENTERLPPGSGPGHGHLRLSSPSPSHDPLGVHALVLRCVHILPPGRQSSQGLQSDHSEEMRAQSNLRVISERVLLWKMICNHKSKNTHQFGECVVLLNNEFPILGITYQFGEWFSIWRIRFQVGDLNFSLKNEFLILDWSWFPWWIWSVCYCWASIAFKLSAVFNYSSLSA